MLKAYIPSKLHTAKEEILKIHPIGAFGPILPKGDKLRDLIEKICSLKLKDVGVIAVGLADNYVASIAEYIPYNYYHVDLTNLIKVIEYRNTKEISKLLYDKWQDSYTNEDCNNKLVELLKNNNVFSDAIDECCGKDVAIKFFKSKNALDELIVLVKNDSHWPNDKLVDRVKKYGILGTSTLFEDLSELFYVFCDRSDYLAADVGDVIAATQKYELNRLHDFLQNFLSEINSSDYKHFELLAKSINNRVGDSGSKNYNEIVATLPPKLIEKYINWINIQKIADFFLINPDRADFWERYIFKRVIPYKNKLTIVFELDSCYAIDFLGKSGAIYFISKDEYENEVRREIATSEESEIKSWLYNNQYTCALWRKEHRGYWQRDVHSFIISRRLARMMVERDR